MRALQLRIRRPSRGSHRARETMTVSCDVLPIRWIGGSGPPSPDCRTISTHSVAESVRLTNDFMGRLIAEVPGGARKRTNGNEAAYGALRQAPGRRAEPCSSSIARNDA